MKKNIPALIIACAALLWGTPVAAFDLGFEINEEEADLQYGEEINELCAGCHGEYGQGGKQGEYPRIAGMPAEYIAKQMVLFRERKRDNMAMIEYVDDRQTPDGDIRDMSVYLAQIELPTKLPPLEEGVKFDPLERLKQAERVMNVPRVPGDVEKGEDLYNRECRSCHGDDGWGRDDKGVPMLAGQYTEYLKRQVPKFISGERIHDEDAPEEKMLSWFSEEELQNIWAFLSAVDDR